MTRSSNNVIYDRMKDETVAIDPNFSVFRLVDRVKTQTQLKHRRTMSQVSFQIENATIRDGSRARVFAGFQRLSRFIPQIARYNQLAANAERVYVFGIPDIDPPNIPGVTYIPLKPTDQLAKEWFLVSYGPDYYSALATEEITDIDDPDPLRVFDGVWTFDLPMVSILHDWLTSAVDAPDPRWTENDRNYRRQVELMSKTITRLTRQLPTTDELSPDSITENEIKTVVKQDVQPALQELTGGAPEPGKERNAVILFADIRDYTSITERLSTRDVVARVLNPYLRIVSEAVKKNGGQIDKFLGDGVLAVFGTEGAQSSDADNALAAAEAIIQSLTWQSKKEFGFSDLPINVGIGIAAGNVIVGKVGSSLRSEQTVIGDAVNVAQRLSELGHNEIWLSAETYDMLTHRQYLEKQIPVQLKGKTDKLAVYRRQNVLS